MSRLASANTTTSPARHDHEHRFSGDLAEDLDAYLAAQAASSMRPIAEDHPLRGLEVFEEGIGHREITLRVSTSGPNAECASMCEWYVHFEMEARDENFEFLGSEEVAYLTVRTVNPYVGGLLNDADTCGTDARVLVEAVFDREEEHVATLSPELDELLGDDYFGGPVALVDLCLVEPRWRGTPLSAILALRALKVFAHMGIAVAALQAAPVEEPRVPGTPRTHGVARIASMWQQAGFQRFYADTGDNGTAQDSEPVEDVFMALSLDVHTIDERMHHLADGCTALELACGNDY